jgi:hypothetical protein
LKLSQHDRLWTERTQLRALLDEHTARARAVIAARRADGFAARDAVRHARGPLLAARQARAALARNSLVLEDQR